MHLLLTLHGMLGLSKDMDHFNELAGPQLQVVQLDGAQGYSYTTQGIDYAAERILDCVQWMRNRDRYTRISLVGHSLGGVVLRQCLVIGLLDLFPNAEPYLFATTVTPHLGVRRQLVR